jgi:hypothetical protein
LLSGENRGGGFNAASIRPQYTTIKIENQFGREREPSARQTEGARTSPFRSYLTALPSAAGRILPLWGGILL